MRPNRPLTAALSLGLLAPAALSQAELTILPGNGPAIDISADGQTVLLRDGALWTSGTVTPITGQTSVVGMDSFGQNLAGNVEDAGFNKAGFYTPGGGWSPVPSISGSGGCDSNLSSGYDISGDGQAVVGLTWDGCAAKAFRWSNAFGLEVLPEDGTGSSRANVASLDGSIVGGWSEASNGQRRPAIWSGGAIQILGSNGEIQALDSFGLISAGSAGTNAAIYRPGQAPETFPALPGISPFDTSSFLGISSTGDVAVGFSGTIFFSSPAPLFWREDVGAVNLQTLAEDLGATVPSPFILNDAYAVSLDGNTIVGGARTFFLPGDGYILTLPDAWLFRDTATISVATGGTQAFELVAGVERAGDFYFMAGSASGTAPGIDLGGVNVPLNPDAYFSFTLASGSAVIAGNFGALDGMGKASASITIPAAASPSLVGVGFDHAYAVIDPATLQVTEASNPQGLTFVN